MAATPGGTAASGATEAVDAGAGEGRRGAVAAAEAAARAGARLSTGFSAFRAAFMASTPGGGCFGSSFAAAALVGVGAADSGLTFTTTVPMGS